MFVEVSNTLDLTYVTGIQRLTRELLARLPGPVPDGAHPVHFVPVRWCHECEGYRRLDPAESERLAHAPAPSARVRSRLARLAEPLPDAAKQRARSVIHHRRVHRLREEIARRRRRRSHPATHAALAIGPWPTPSFFFDMEAGWHDHVPRSRLLPELRRAGVDTAVVIPDVMPELWPEWFDPAPTVKFVDYLRAHLRNSVHLVCISECSRRDALALAERLGVDPLPSASVTTMGADFTVGTTPVVPPTDVTALRYALCVSTLEPRKNHALLLDAYDAIRDRVPDFGLVFVGKIGWKTEALIDRIRSHPDLGTRIHWFDRLDDPSLEGIYDAAHCVVMPSFYEGFGLPIIEALSRGVPTLSSNGGALPEAGGDRVDYFDPTSVDELVALLLAQLEDAPFHAERRARLADYRAPTWADGATMILDAFSDLAVRSPRAGATGSAP